MPVALQVGSRTLVRGPIAASRSTADSAENGSWGRCVLHPDERGGAMVDTRRRMSPALLFSRAPGECAWRERLAGRGTLTAAALAIALAGGCGSGHGAREHTAAIAQSPATAAEVSSLLAGIRQQGSTLGDPKAPVTLEYFADLQCPFCRRFTLLVLPSLIQRYVRSGELKIE